MENDFKVNIHFSEIGEGLEEVLTRFLANLLKEIHIDKKEE